MHGEGGLKMKSKRSSRTSASRSTVAEVVAVVLESPLGKRVTDFVGITMERLLKGAEEKKSSEELGREAAEAMRNLERELTSDTPYRVLGVAIGAPQRVVRAAWLASMKEFHADGKHPDEQEATRLNNAYATICRDRGWRR